MRLRIQFTLFRVTRIYIYFQFTRTPPISK